MRISIILNEPENPDNIGAAARAMKNMGLKDMRLVNPPEEWRSKASKMAVRADPLLSQAKVYVSLQEAVKDISLVIGTTRREGGRRKGFLSFEEALKKMGQIKNTKRAAVVFGKESKGLSNEDLHQCDFYTTIPSDPAFPSLNLAQAVMVVCFSLFTNANGLRMETHQSQLQLVTKEEFESVIAAFNKAVRHLEYKPQVAERIDFTFRSMLKRGGLTKSEGQMIKGISKRICDRTFPIIKKGGDMETRHK